MTFHPNILVMCIGLLLTGFRASAQTPTQVDIDLVPNADPTKLEVRVRPLTQSFSGIVSALSFTIRWAASSSASLGTRTQFCAAGFSLSPSVQVTNGAFK